MPLFEVDNGKLVRKDIFGRLYLKPCQLYT
jgi:hypothetical protein